MVPRDTMVIKATWADPVSSAPMEVVARKGLLETKAMSAFLAHLASVDPLAMLASEVHQV